MHMVSDPYKHAATGQLRTSWDDELTLQESEGRHWDTKSHHGRMRDDESCVGEQVLQRVLSRPQRAITCHHGIARDAKSH